MRCPIMATSQKTYMEQPIWKRRESKHASPPVIRESAQKFQAYFLISTDEIESSQAISLGKKEKGKQQGYHENVSVESLILARTSCSTSNELQGQLHHGTPEIEEASDSIIPLKKIHHQVTAQVVSSQLYQFSIIITPTKSDGCGRRAG